MATGSSNPTPQLIFNRRIFMLIESCIIGFLLFIVMLLNISLLASYKNTKDALELYKDMRNLYDNILNNFLKFENESLKLIKILKKSKYDIYENTVDTLALKNGGFKVFYTQLNNDKTMDWVSWFYIKKSEKYLINKTSSNFKVGIR
jgi:hypothetical protein